MPSMRTTGRRSRRALLLAMSGVRVKDEELARLGLTLPGFVERSEVIASLPSLGLLTLAAHTPEGWEVEYRELDAVTEVDVAHLVEGRYDVIAISSLAARVLDAYALADRLRAEGVTVVLGGLHASALPDEAAQHADSVVDGEGELLWPALLHDLDEGRLHPRYGARSGAWPAFRIEDARVPRYDLLDIARYNRLTLQTTRGCPLACTFCAASRLISPYKRKPIPLIRRELDAIVEVWPRPFIELADDNTFVQKPWARELARLFAEYNARRTHAIAWFTETDISVADDPELLDLLAEANCAELLIGLESTDPAALRAAEPRGFKAAERARYVDSVGRIQERGIPVNGCFVLGFDEDDGGVFERTLAFARECDLAEVQITVLTPFPGTALYSALEAQGRLLRPVFWDACTLFDVTFRPARMSVEELEQGFRWLMGELYSPEETARRRTRFRRATRARRGRHAQS
ncbi:B12-binding domain-containing radical SAM protein [Sorangium sp. So ce1078]|uniref:B12-binding domain-containing radical SAM protein n=1 Tax=Sorangium sp. So ce1078 TaxID=3133329 RepID=UPI003F63E9EE